MTQPCSVLCCWPLTGQKGSIITGMDYKSILPLNHEPQLGSWSQDIQFLFLFLFPIPSLSNNTAPGKQIQAVKRCNYRIMRGRCSLGTGTWHRNTYTHRTPASLAIQGYEQRAIWKTNYSVISLIYFFHARQWGSLSTKLTNKQG